MAAMADAYRESLASEELRARLARLLDEKRRPR